MLERPCLRGLLLAGGWASGPEAEAADQDADGFAGAAGELGAATGVDCGEAAEVELVRSDGDAALGADEVEADGLLRVRLGKLLGWAERRSQGQMGFRITQ